MSTTATALRLAANLPTIAALLGLGVLFAAATPAQAAEKPVAHSVFFTLKDHSASSREAFIASCMKYLTGHEGVTSFSVSTAADDLDEPGVSVHDFDVALLVVFSSKATEGKYLKHPRHLKFVEENKASFEKVRVFDSYVTTAPTP